MPDKRALSTIDLVALALNILPKEILVGLVESTLGGNLYMDYHAAKTTTSLAVYCIMGIIIITPVYCILEYAATHARPALLLLKCRLRLPLSYFSEFHEKNSVALGAVDICICSTF